VDAYYPPERLHELLAECDYVVLSVPLTRETERLIGEAELRAMRRTAYLVNVARGRVVDEQALVRARKEMGEFADVFEAGVLPASIEVHLRPGMRSPDTVKSVAERIRTYAFVDDVRYGEEWVEKLYRLRNIATVAGIALGVAFAAVAVIIIGATIRMTVLARAKEISIMRLVGATDMFIRLPFLIDGLVKGVLGGLLALLFVWIANRVVSEYFIQTIFFDREMVFVGVVGGALMGVIGSLVSVGRHLRRI